MGSWSLEELYLQVTVNDTSAKKDCFTFEGLKLHGASWANNSLSISNASLSTVLGPTRFTWLLKGKNQKSDMFATVPVYLDHTREQFLFSVELKRPSSIPKATWAQRGVCLT